MPPNWLIAAANRNETPESGSVSEMTLNWKVGKSKIFQFEPRSEQEKALKLITIGLFIDNLPNFINSKASDLAANTPNSNKFAKANDHGTRSLTEECSSGCNR